MALKLYQYPKCSTCRKAARWLSDRQIAADATDLVLTPPSVSVLKDLKRRSLLPIAKFFNTSGESYRAGNFKERLKTMSEAEAFSELAKDGKLIKRPILDTGREVLVGFDEKAYASVLKPKG
ncbi:MAG: Spx/MgsR family RNA polymerase-binding regulatory protein [Polyangiaceae bacterium]|nr:Spx/MgsR family RNA polymerase-binding regulatory protein [Polyangiaceae bacterium]